MRLVLRGGRVICPATGQDRVADVLVEGDRIAAVGGFDPARVDGRRVECAGKVVTPGLVDLFADLCDPGRTWCEDLVSGTEAAAAGGFTTVLVAPDTDPVLHDPSTVRDLVARARREGKVSVLAAAALTRDLAGQELAELGLMAEAGAAAFSQSQRHVEDTLVLLNALRYARPFERPVLIPAGDRPLERLGAMHEGSVSSRIGLRGLPASAEDLGVARLVALARATGAQVHVTGISSALGLRQLLAAQAGGLAITGSTPAINLFLTDEAVLASGYDTNTRLMPPLRSEEDRQALVAAVRAGKLIVTSHHRPLTPVEKEVEYEYATPGALGLETALGCTLAGTGDVHAALRALSAAPAEVLRLDRRVEVGAPAELLVVDLDAQSAVEPTALRSRSRNTPLAGQVLPGVVHLVVHRGKVVQERRASAR